jgi:hypothetical protein
MTPNAWFSKLRADGVIASGNSGIYLTHLDNTDSQESPVGIGPIWAGRTLVYNRNDNTTQIGKLNTITRAYNDYVGSDCGEWAGFDSRGVGKVDRWGLDVSNEPMAFLLDSIFGVCAPRFLGGLFGYLSPYQSDPDGNIRSLIIDRTVCATGIITDWVADKTGGFFLYVVANGTYTRRIYTQKHQDVTIRVQQDEVPLVAFIGPDGYPWMMSGTTNSGTFVRMIYAAFGYRIEDDLFNPDCRMIDKQLRVVGSDSRGLPRYNIWIDFNSPLIDLRLV